MSKFFQIVGSSPASRGYKRLLLANAGGNTDPITGTKLVSTNETFGQSGVTTVTLKDGMNSTAERLPSHMLRWWWDISSEIGWGDEAIIELLIEFTTATSSSDDVNHWLGIASGTSQSDLGGDSYFGGFVHSTVFITVPRPGRFRNGNVGLSNSGSANGRHMHITINKNKNLLSGASLAKALDSSYELDAQLGDFANWSPGSTSDPFYIVFCAGTNRNVALGSGSNVTTNMRLWYRITSLQP